MYVFYSTDFKIKALNVLIDETDSISLQQKRSNQKGSLPKRKTPCFTDILGFYCQNLVS